MRERLTRLLAAIDDTVKQLREKGELSSRHETYVGDLKKRQEELHAKLETAVRDNNVWDALKHELELDSSALISEFRSWAEDLDTAHVKPRD
ncbi:hypothetical protein [Breoghania sp.]|uniref:hypothetical protein n=1 Tax=Breoghania sp. TaxID=2065378 RepID=UPI0026084025|nr:hypothetical protein [Breoghania sp.]MDJ0932629.1 hypothetical protein [Breoghania sp.]